MEPTDALGELEAERLDLCTFLNELDPVDWATPSLCTGWTVHQLVAHLCLGTRESMRDFVVGMVRYRGSFDRMTLEQARTYATHFAPDELVVQLPRHGWLSTVSVR